MYYRLMTFSHTDSRTSATDTYTRERIKVTFTNNNIKSITGDYHWNLNVYMYNMYVNAALCFTFSGTGPG